MLHRFFLAVPLAIALVVVPSAAYAQVDTSAYVDDTQPSTAAPAVSPPKANANANANATATEPYWYGWQTLTADAASVGVVGAGIASRSEPVAMIGVAGVYLGAPIVHLANDRVGIAFASIGLRLGLPSVGAVIGYVSAGPCPESESRGWFGCTFHGWSEAAAGGLIGLGTAMALDAALLAHGKRPASAPRESGMPRLTSVAPSYDPSTRSTAVGLGGTF